MTVEKILTNLELCAKGLCEHCDRKNEQEMCRESLNVDIATVIKNQQAEIDRLKVENKLIQTNIYKKVMENGLAEKAKAEAIKECIKICEQTEKEFSHICKSKKEAREETCRYEGALAVKRKLKEMVGADNG